MCMLSTAIKLCVRQQRMGFCGRPLGAGAKTYCYQEVFQDGYKQPAQACPKPCGLHSRVPIV